MKGFQESLENLMDRKNPTELSTYILLKWERIRY